MARDQWYYKCNHYFHFVCLVILRLLSYIIIKAKVNKFALL